MITQEMHIGIDLEVQKINSNYTSDIGSEEKDWFLNSEMMRLVKDRLKQLEQNQKRYDDLQTLVTTPNSTLDVYLNDDKSVFAYLPANYMYLLNDRSLTKDLCGAVYNPSIVAVHFFSACYLLPVTVTDNYTALEVLVNDVSIYKANVTFPSGIPSASSKFTLYNEIIDALNSVDGIEAKYENYKGKTCKGGIVVTSNIAFTLKNKFVNTTPQEVTLSITDNTVNKIGSVAGSAEFDNRLSRNSDDYKLLLGTNFGTTFFDSPISVIQRNKLIVFHNKKFIASGVNVTYLRRPKKISLTLNQGCELSEDVHEEIVVAAARRIAGITNSDNYRNIINEDSLKE